MGRGGEGARGAPDLRLVVVTGLSGAGKSEAIKSLEDLGFFCVDNLPPALIPTFADLLVQTGGRVNRAALVIDVRGREFLDDAVSALRQLEAKGVPFQVLFLEASDEALVNRFKETRRRHPLAPGGRILAGIEAERQRLEPLRGLAHRIVDTTGMTPRALRERLRAWYGSGADTPLVVTILSFGFKHGIPLDVDLLVDVRFLPNPHYVPSLRERTGRDPQVVEYVLGWPVTQRFLQLFGGLLDFLLPQYVSEGKSSLTIGIGCTGGRHRSVVIADVFAARIAAQGFRVVTEHRDCDRPEGGDDA